MKPTSYFHTHSNARRSDRKTIHRPLPQPKIEYYFRGPDGPRMSAGQPETNDTVPSPRFREISRQYLNGESHAAFAAEASLFLVVSGIAAVPIAQTLREIARLMGFV